MTAPLSRARPLLLAALAAFLWLAVSLIASATSAAASDQPDRDGGLLSSAAGLIHPDGLAGTLESAAGPATGAVGNVLDSTLAVGTTAVTEVVETVAAAAEAAVPLLETAEILVPPTPSDTEPAQLAAVTTPAVHALPVFVAEFESAPVLRTDTAAQLPESPPTPAPSGSLDEGVTAPTAGGVPLAAILRASAVVDLPSALGAVASDLLPQAPTFDTDSSPD